MPLDLCCHSKRLKKAMLVDTLEPDGDVDMYDLAILASAWPSIPGDNNWNPACDISDPNDNVINMLDLTVFLDNQLDFR